MLNHGNVSDEYIAYFLLGHLDLLQLPGQKLGRCVLIRWESRPLIVHRSYWQEDE